MKRKALISAAAAMVLLSGCDKQVAISKNDDATALVANSKWLETTSVTPEGGMLMGNPEAKIKLIEYGALSCSHCAEFAEQSHDGLRAMISQGSVSYEFRNFLLSAVDVPAAILARCGGPGPFFTITDQLYATQPQWLGLTKDITPTEQSRWQTFPPDLLAQVLADKLGLVQFVRERGVSEEKAKACLADKTAIGAIGKMTDVAVNQFKISGTPTFMINGVVVPETSTWEKLEPALKAAGA